jgi:hypothetical protein
MFLSMNLSEMGDTQDKAFLSEKCYEEKSGHVYLLLVVVGFVIE